MLMAQALVSEPVGYTGSVISDDPDPPQSVGLAALQVAPVIGAGSVTGELLAQGIGSWLLTITNDSPAASASKRAKIIGCRWGLGTWRTSNSSVSVVLGARRRASSTHTIPTSVNWSNVVGMTYVIGQ